MLCNITLTYKGHIQGHKGGQKLFFQNEMKHQGKHEQGHLDL